MMTDFVSNEGDRAWRGETVGGKPPLEAETTEVQSVSEPASESTIDPSLSETVISPALRHATRKDIGATMRVVSRMESLGNKSEYSQEDIRYLADQLYAIVQKVPGIGIEIDLSKMSYPEMREDIYATEISGRPGVYKLWERGLESAGEIGIITNPDKYTDDVRPLN
jgi:hypothetical protein